VRQFDVRPLAIVHGLADTRVPEKHAEQLTAAIRAGGGTVDPWIPAGVGHVRAAFPATAEYERRLVAFLSSAIGSPGP
jgi:dipeptidyl aminopeptidase/acylaminoacyl peptidase